VLDAPAWRERRGGLGEGWPLAREYLRTWHRREAQAAEDGEDWFAARWHLRPLSAASPDDGTLRARLGRACVELGRWAEADAELSRAIELGAAGSEEWYHRGFARLRLGRAEEAAADMTKVLRLKPGHVSALSARAVLRARQGQWEKASADFARAVEAGEVPLRLWSGHALVRLHLRDAAGYRDACRGALRQYAGNADPAVPAGLAWACALGPGAGEEMRAVLPLLERAKAAEGGQPVPRQFGLSLRRALGFALYRTGKAEEAVRHFRAALAVREHDPAVWLFLALAHHGRGDAEEAARWLAKAAGWMDRPPPKDAAEAARRDSPSWGDLIWSEQLALRVLRGEAEALLGKTRP
jgi:tetratricopeptide (TPR) repeat protein